MRLSIFVLMAVLSFPFEIGSARAAAPAHGPADGFRYVGNCAKGSNWSRVESSPRMRAMLKAVSQISGGQYLPVYSCFRPQARQEEILRANHCAPNYGKMQCAGRVAAEVSEHTRGVAGDFYLQAQGGSPEAFCRLLDKARSQANGGRGGITYYGTGKVQDPASGHYMMMAGLHLDVGTDGGEASDPAHGDWCNWGECMRVLGEGHCKRTKFRLKKAELELQLARANLEGSRAAVGRLSKALASLQADCKPGSTQCRDNFQ